jgi:hypothetical protein
MWATIPDLFVEIMSNFLLRLALNFGPPNVHLQSSYDYTCVPPHQADFCFFYNVFTYFFYLNECIYYFVNFNGVMETVKVWK